MNLRRSHSFDCRQKIGGSLWSATLKRERLKRDNGSAKRSELWLIPERWQQARIDRCHCPFLDMFGLEKDMYKERRKGTAPRTN